MNLTGPTFSELIGLRELDESYPCLREIHSKSPRSYSKKGRHKAVNKGGLTNLINPRFTRP